LFCHYFYDLLFMSFRLFWGVPIFCAGKITEIIAYSEIYFKLFSFLRYKYINFAAQNDVMEVAV